MAGLFSAYPFVNSLRLVSFLSEDDVESLIREKWEFFAWVVVNTSRFLRDTK